MSGDQLRVVPIAIKEANRYVRAWHRHHKPPQQALFAVAVADHERVRGIAILAPPVARMLADGWTIEVNRVATDGARNACSMLYGAAWRAAKALGYTRIITYTLPEEGGASLRASGWVEVGSAGGGEWSVPSRHRAPATFPTSVKTRWQNGDTRGEPRPALIPDDANQDALFGDAA